MGIINVANQYGTKKFVFIGFPCQWLPIFEWYSTPWKDSIPPLQYIPFFSDMSEKEILTIISRAKQQGVLRTLVESVAMLDPILSDFLYIVDNTTWSRTPMLHNELLDISKQHKNKRQVLMLTGWQSYGRPSIKALEDEVAKIIPNAKIAVALPCARTRPYDGSPTHKKVYRLLRDNGYKVEELHRVVISSLGVLPEEVWCLPQVMGYDAGVPDIYRILRLVRSFFGRVKYDYVLDCLQFTPYSDVLEIAQKDGIIKEIKKIPVPKKRYFVIRN